MITPMKAIRAKCLECSGGNRAEVKACPIEKCPLYVYRSGHRPPKTDLTASGGETIDQTT